MFYLVPNIVCITDHINLINVKKKQQQAQNVTKNDM